MGKRIARPAGGTVRRAGFTMVELMIVVVIIGVLASVAVTQYFKVVERGRTAEARMLLLQLRSAQKSHKTDYGEYSANISELDADAPDACVSTNFFRYSVNTTGNYSTATRCTADGKGPNNSEEYNITIDYQSGVISAEPGRL